MTLKKHLSIELWKAAMVFDVDLDFLRIHSHNIEQFLKTIAHCVKSPYRIPIVKLTPASTPIPAPVPSISAAVYLWHDGTIINMLRALFDHAVFDHAILADMLVDAGLDNDELVSHLRQESHRPDCWAIWALVNDLPETVHA